MRIPSWTVWGIIGVSTLLFFIFFIMPPMGMSETWLSKICKTNLKEIAVAIMQYEQDTNMPPPSLEFLVAEKRLKKENLECCLACHHGGFSVNGLRYFGHFERNTGNNNYIYLRPAQIFTGNVNGKKTIICLDALKNHYGTTNDVNVLYNDGTTATIMINDLSPELIKSINKQKF